jgi:hypothetical protein
MPAPLDDIDGVALNVLLAEGVDLPTALEASRRDSHATSPESGCLGVVVLIVAAVGAAAAFL